MVAVLDNFHFDLSLIQSTSHDHAAATSGTTDGERQAPSVSEGERESAPLLEEEEREEERGGMEVAMAGQEDNDGGKDLDAEEEGESMDSTSDERERCVLREEADVAKQLALAKKIHKAIVSSILPSLEAVLTKRVSTFV